MQRIDDDVFWIPKNHLWLIIYDIYLPFLMVWYAGPVLFADDQLCGVPGHTHI
jgi:hypothetical protein